ncbi:hypothetical protein LOTGIDRAFT_199832 [Lottia gigantea]|uniref:Uncharacterized protein n=1 Tax=Lottia gigantea TaxID=225164 RepID=V4B8Z8_LOTGI|nr:hypothetical protein LOTGIDRAFT_199832 [Lottia gigantea]ESP02302.1 hypothetical protein LOTGIDRAFT_199832 [Lottia gigantea]
MSIRNSGSYTSFDKSNIKCVIVGDTCVGKTCLARRLAAHDFPTEYSPTMFDNYAATTIVDDQPYVLSLFDTAGQEEFDRLRALAYMNSDVFLLCFSVARPDTLQHAIDIWIPELKHYSPNTPIILIGTQIDIRDEQEAKSKSSVCHRDYVQTKEGISVASKLGAETYVECSSLTEAGIIRLKESAIDASNKSTKPRNNDCNCCQIV